MRLRPVSDEAKMVCAGRPPSRRAEPWLYTALLFLSAGPQFGGILLGAPTSLSLRVGVLFYPSVLSQASQSEISKNGGGE